ncbi:MAG: hypothetical protein QOF51_585, partial [Chloroflexota bacterium]|nr:hypothetical protein [Chloroflexota bacterium]
YTRDAAAPIRESTLAILPSSSATLYQGADDQLPDQWVGSATVESLTDQPVAAVVNEVNANGSASSYVGITKRAPQVNAPLLFKNSGGWNTGIQVQNLGTLPAVVTATYTASGNARGPWTEQATIQPGGSTTLYQPANPDLPDQFVGSAVLQSDRGQPLAAVVNEVRTDSTASTSYDAFTAGSPTAYLPLLYRGFVGWNSGVQVQNLAATPATVRMTVYNQDGSTLTTLTNFIPAGASRTFYLPSFPTVPPGFAGSAVVTSGAGEPLATIVNHVKPPSAPASSAQDPTTGTSGSSIVSGASKSENVARS